MLLRLPMLYRVPLVLVYMDGFLAKEVARVLGVPLGTVQARLHRGRAVREGAVGLRRAERPDAEARG